MRELRAPCLATGLKTGVLLPFVAPILAGRGFTPDGMGHLLPITSLAIVAAGLISGHVGDVLLGRQRTLHSAALLSAIAALVLGEPLALPWATRREKRTSGSGSCTVRAGRTKASEPNGRILAARSSPSE
jgi:MFS family permease